ncbi:hypothetical protein CBR_g22292 [Chara braunii]|uniref:NTF2 domain-containing protein n=1 Tax=Chara braunii TaxID=69332 RepID=A0A388L2J2_CHABU|nr:hypothetical protein CBR_g22292 [Chara braunii]|eukprot:GBG76544.1 hypothetical protein CBR_g22292 [Chara braunii]
MMATSVKSMHMVAAASSSGTLPQPPQAYVVGNSFVSQYYNVLHHSPQVVHRFYTDASTFTRADAGTDGAVSTMVGQRAIHDKVMEQRAILEKAMERDGLDWKAEIKTVDSQYSLNGGVLVMVTGALADKGHSTRNFVQSFFLAPQETGYYVLNDIFRYLDKEEQPTPPVSLHYANGIPETTPPPAAAAAAAAPDVKLKPAAAAPVPAHAANEGIVLEREFAMESATSDVALPTIETPGTEETCEVPAEDEEEDVVSEMAAESVPPPPAPEEHQMTVPAEEPAPQQLQEIAETVPNSVETPSEEASGVERPKLSYAAMLRQRDSGGMGAAVAAAPAAPPAVQTKPAPPVTDSQVHPQPVTAGPPPVAQPIASPMSDNMDEGLNPDAEVDGRSVFVKNLPISITTQQLEEELSRFGPVKAGGVNIKGPKNSATGMQQGSNCYAFVEFEDQAAAHAAIEASPIQIMGKQVGIEEKKPLGRGRGRGGPGRGDRPYRPMPRGYPSGRGRLPMDRDGRGDRENRNEGNVSRGGRGMRSNMGGMGMQPGMSGDSRRLSTDGPGGPRMPRRNMQPQMSRGGSGVGRAPGASAQPV